MPFRRVRYSLAQVVLAVSLAAILLSAGVLFWRSSRTPEYWTSAIAFSPDGETIAASLFAFDRVQVWHPTPRVLGADQSHSFSLFDLPGLRNERLLQRTTLAGMQGVAWPVRKIGHGQSLAFSHDGTMLATKGLENSISIWNKGSGQKIREVSINEELSNGLSWADDGKLEAVSKLPN